MKHRLASWIALAAFVLGVGSLSSGFTVLFTVSALELLEVALGLGLLGLGFSSWIAGIFILGKTR